MAAGSFTGIRFEAPDPEEKNPEGKVDSKPNAGADKTPAPEKDERYEVLQNELQELRQSNRQLVELVGRQAPQPQQTAPVVEDAQIDWGKDEDEEIAADEPEDPAQLVEDLSKLGKDALAKRGFVRMADVKKLVREESRKAATTAATQLVSRARTEVTRESAVVNEFPELADPESDLFKATAAYVRAAVKIDPAAAKSPATLYLAAQNAKADLHAKGGGRRAKPGEANQFEDDFEPEEDDREPVLRERRQPTERDRRIAAQQGDRGQSGRSRIQSDGDGFVMSPEAKSIASMMGISDDEYKVEATRIRKAAGVSGRRR